MDLVVVGRDGDELAVGAERERAYVRDLLLGGHLPRRDVPDEEVALPITGDDLLVREPANRRGAALVAFEHRLVAGGEVDHVDEGGAAAAEDGALAIRGDRDG